MTVQERGAATADIRAVRAELDELLRARQFAAQRERRLVEALRGAAAPEAALDRPRSGPDPELARQLAQAQGLREGLGTRCLELSERLLAMEDALRRNGAAEPRAGTAAPASGAAVDAPRAAPARRRPTGARFGGVYTDQGGTADDGAAAVTVVEPAVATPARGARFGGARHPAPGGGADGAASAVVAAADPVPGPAGDGADEVPGPRSVREVADLAGRISGLHRRGAAQESAAVAAQAAVTLAPGDVVRLAWELRTGGPYGAAGYLARAAAHGSARQAAETLAELRRAGMVDEAAELFHALWGVPASDLPGLLVALERAGQAADGQTLLWEWASAPPAELASLAVRLAEVGRDGDVRSLLCQTAGRPVVEVCAVLSELSAAAGAPAVADRASAGSSPAGGLCAALASRLVREVVRMRSAADLCAFGAAVADLPVLYGTLLEAVAASEDARARNALAALRAAGLPTVPAAVRSGRGRGRR